MLRKTARALFASASARLGQVENVEAKLRESEEQYGKVASEKGAMEQELVAKLLALSTEMERAVLTRMEHEVRHPHVAQSGA